jgi:hypothetical protein
MDHVVPISALLASQADRSRIWARRYTEYGMMKLMRPESHEGMIQPR